MVICGVRNKLEKSSMLKIAVNRPVRHVRILGWSALDIISSACVLTVDLMAGRATIVRSDLRTHDLASAHKLVPTARLFSEDGNGGSEPINREVNDGEHRSIQEQESVSVSVGIRSR